MTIFHLHKLGLGFLGTTSTTVQQNETNDCVFVLFINFILFLSKTVLSSRYTLHTHYMPSPPPPAPINGFHNFCGAG